MQNNRIGGEDTMLKTIDFSTKKNIAKLVFQF